MVRGSARRSMKCSARRCHNQQASPEEILIERGGTGGRERVERDDDCSDFASESAVMMLANALAVLVAIASVNAADRDSRSYFTGRNTGHIANSRPAVGMVDEIDFACPRKGENGVDLGEQLLPAYPG